MVGTCLGCVLAELREILAFWRFGVLAGEWFVTARRQDAADRGCAFLPESKRLS